MNKEKQIEEMAKSVCHLDRTCDECMTSFECKAMIYAKRFYTAGYRKTSNLIEEVMKWLEEKGFLNIEVWAIQDVKAELKKKYTEEGK